MPYSSNADLPPSVHDHLPDHAQDIFRAAFNSAFEDHPDDEEAVFRIAWAAVKRMYVKEGGEWVPRGVPG
jgi:cation transport regulator